MFNPRSQLLLLYIAIGGALLMLYQRDPTWQQEIDVLRDSIVLTWTVSLMNIIFLGNGLNRLLGLRPRQPWGLVGIVFSPLLHRDVGHLIANTLPFMVLGWLILLQADFSTSQADFYTITITILMIGGLGTWLFGRNAIHLGASGLIFGYIGFLLVNGYVGPTLLTVGFAAIVLLMYGNNLWSMLPSSNENTISWEGHLFGFAGGVIAGLQPDLLATVGSILRLMTQ